MSARTQTQTKAASIPKPLSAPVQSQLLQRKCACGGSPGIDGECAQCRDRRLSLHRRATNPAAPPEVPPIVHGVLSSPGQSLDADTRAFMESRFGHDFSQVRVHTDARAAESTRAVNALAYTVGRDVVFDRGQYEPRTNEGRRLLAHELTHVVQQRESSSLGGRLEISHDNPSDEEANRFANTFLQNMQPSQLTTSPRHLILARQQIPETEFTGGLAETEVEDQPTTFVQHHYARKAPETARKRRKQSEPKKEKAPEATTPSEDAKKALKHAKELNDQTEPGIWFDSWNNDLRDNDLNGKIDDAKEQVFKDKDGQHNDKIYDAMICDRPDKTTDECPTSQQSRIKVLYRVCIDIPIESYKAAGVPISNSRWIPTFFGELSKKPGWTVWKKPNRPSQLLDGDIVAASNPAHQHAGIVDTGFIDNVINLPGPTSAQKYGLFYPSGKNDMKSVPRALFELVLKIDWIARFNGK